MKMVLLELWLIFEGTSLALQLLSYWFKIIEVLFN